MEEPKRGSSEFIEVVSPPIDDAILAGKVSLWQSVKTYPKIVGCCLGLTAAILLYGYDLAIVGTVSAMPEFQYVDSPIRCLTPADADSRTEKILA